MITNESANMILSDSQIDELIDAAYLGSYRDGDGIEKSAFSPNISEEVRIYILVSGRWENVVFIDKEIWNDMRIEEQRKSIDENVFRQINVDDFGQLYSALRRISDKFKPSMMQLGFGMYVLASNFVDITFYFEGRKQVMRLKPDFILNHNATESYIHQYLEMYRFYLRGKGGIESIYLTALNKSNNISIKVSDDIYTEIITIN